MLNKQLHSRLVALQLDRRAHREVAARAALAQQICAGRIGDAEHSLRQAEFAVDAEAIVVGFAGRGAECKIEVVNSAALGDHLRIRQAANLNARDSINLRKTMLFSSTGQSSV